MSQQNLIDETLEAAVTRIQDEIGGLLGVDFQLSVTTREVVFEKAAYAGLASRQVRVWMDIAGDIRGQGCLLVGVRDAIRLGGTLIMLPSLELDEFIGHEEFSEEIEDSFGEIANVITDCLNREFAEMFPESCRIIRKEQEVIAPVQLAKNAEKPRRRDKSWYQMRCAMALEGKRLGMLVVLLPAESFHLLQETNLGDFVVMQQSQEFSDTDVSLSLECSPEKMAPEPCKSGELLQPDKSSVSEIADFQTKAEKLLADCGRKVAGEVGALLGKQITLNSISNKSLDIEQFFLHESSPSQIIVTFDVQAAVQAKSYLVMDLPVAIRIGGELMMIPAEELESMITAELFGEDIEDACSEVINVIAEVYSAAFEAHCAKRIRFTKTALQQMISRHGEAVLDKSCTNHQYYLSSMVLAADDEPGDTIHVFFPLELFDFDRQEIVNNPLDGQMRKGVTWGEKRSGVAGEEVCPVGGRDIPGDAADSLDILLIHDEEGETAKISKVLRDLGYSTRELTFKDNVHRYISGELKAIYLVMKDVNEQAFGTAIKVSSACSVPLIAAGPGWTRSKVIKAVKYGVHDILLTPASPGDIEKNVMNNLLQCAA